MCGVGRKLLGRLGGLDTMLLVSFLSVGWAERRDRGGAYENAEGREDLTFCELRHGFFVDALVFGEQKGRK